MRTDTVNRITVSSTARARSPETFENALDLASPCCPSKENGNFKENTGINKSGASNLSLEPQQMKRKKKGGKQNLRKSLAWDRAFFTEEGVLDPLELSAISGLSSRGGLPFIGEGTPVSSGQDKRLHQYKGNDLSSPNLEVSFSDRATSTSLASHRVPTNADRKSVSKCGDCPRPLPSPSLKRLANANIGKATGSELKLSKVPGLKSGLTPTCATTRSRILRGSRMKHNQITQPDFSNQRDLEVKSSFKIHKKTENTLRATTLQSADHSDGNSGSSSFCRHLSTNMIPMTVDRANSGLNLNPVNVTQTRPESSCDSQRYDSTTFATSYTQNYHIKDRTLQNQTAKPSGLRMPSPSLSFFSQPKPSSFRDLPRRDTHSVGFGSQNRGSLRLPDNLSRTTKSYDKIPDSRIRSSKAICSHPESNTSSHFSAIDLIKPNLEQRPMYEAGLDVHSDVSDSHLGDKRIEDNNKVFDRKIQDLPKNNMFVRIFHEEAESQKVAIEVHSENGSREKALDNFLENAVGNSPVKSDSCGSESRNAELVVSKHNYGIPESQVISAIDSTQCTYGFDDRVQNTAAIHSDQRKSSEPNCHEAHLEKTDPLKYSLPENDKVSEKESCREKERATEQLDLSRQNEIYCRENTKALVQGEAMAESPYIESKHLHATEVLTDNSPAAELDMQNSVFVSMVEGCKNDTNLMHEVGEAMAESPQVQDFQQKFAKRNEKLKISDRMLAEKQLSPQNLQQDKFYDELPLVSSDREEGNKVIDAKMLFSLPLGKRHKSILGKERDSAQSLRMAVRDSVGSSFSSQSCNSPISTFSDDVSTSYGNLSDFVHQLLPDGTLIQVSSMENGLTSKISVKDSESDIDSLKGLQDTRTLPVQSSESNMLNNCCFGQSECSVFAGDELVAGNLVHGNEVGSMKDSVSSETEVYESISRSSTPEDESPSKHENCDEEHGTGGSIEDTIMDPSVEAFSDTVNVGVSEEANKSLCFISPKLDTDKVETTLLSTNEHGDVLEQKSLSVVIPPNATPFSDEWLAAIEAAGEDILTRKSGAVQNSPPEKSVPEPSPWSPVKRKNNHIGPFDCTKKFPAPSHS